MADRRLTGLIAVALLAVLASSAVAALAPVLVKEIVDNLTLPGAYVAVGFLIIGYVGAQWISRVLGELGSLAIGRADQALHRHLSLKLVKHVMSLPLSFHLSRRTGAISQILANGLLGYRLILQHCVRTLLPVVVELSIVSTVLIMLGQPVFLGIISASLVSYAIVFSIGAKRLSSPARGVSAASIDANAMLTDSVINCETIKTFCAESFMHERLDKAFAHTEEQWANLLSCKTLIGVAAATIFGLSVGVTVYFAVYNVQHESMSLGEFVLVHTYLLQIFRPMEALGFAFRDAAQAIAFIERLGDLLLQKTEQCPVFGGKHLPRGPGDVVFEQVTFSYDGRKPILRDVSFTVRAGTMVAVVGPSGSGKTTLIRLLLRLCDPDQGRILFGGIQISEVSMSELRGAIAVVPQDVVLLNDSIASNIAIGGSRGTMRGIIEAAKLACIHDTIAASPDGYQTQVGERGARLSGGEKQRIAIARAALRRPRVLVLDESTSSLDSATEQLILNELWGVTEKATKLVVAHRLSTIVTADQIIVLDQGELVERGSHSELIELGGVYRRMWLEQQRRIDR
jgi:ATP-binding cassette subfamily B protein